MRQIAIALSLVAFLPSMVLADDLPTNWGGSHNQSLVSESHPTSTVFSRSPIARTLDGRKAGRSDLYRYDGFNLLPDVLDGGRTCYTMRSYFVRQEDPQSDATTLVGYSTCQSASKFKVKVTDQP